VRLAKRRAFLFLDAHFFLFSVKSFNILLGAPVKKLASLARKQFDVLAHRDRVRLFREEYEKI
jgi:hypothetical protein